MQGDGDIPMTDPGNPVVKTGRKIKEVTASAVVVVNEDGNEEHYPYDTFIVSMGRKSNDELFKELKEVIPETYSIGDANKVGEITDAMTAANEIARKI